jgi:hypothetical protein
MKGGSRRQFSDLIAEGTGSGDARIHGLDFVITRANPLAALE